MPSPVGHALGGAIVSLVMAPNGLGPWGLGLGRNAFTLVALAAVLPDIDFAWGGHNRETHSLGAAVLAGLPCSRGSGNESAARDRRHAGVVPAMCCSTGWDRTTRRRSA